MVDAVVVEHGDGWSGWVTFGQEPTAEQVRALSVSCVRCTGFAPHPGFPARCRPPARGWPRGHVAEAADAARLAATRPETGYFLYVDQLGMAQLLLEWTRTDTFEPAANALLAPLAGRPATSYARSPPISTPNPPSPRRRPCWECTATPSRRGSRGSSSCSDVDLGRPDERLALHLACRTVILAEES